MNRKPANLYTLKQLLEKAEAGRYAVGAFSARSTLFIPKILEAGQETRSPLIVQVAQVELERYDMTASEVADAFFAAVADLHPIIPIGLHLDHTKKFEIIAEAIGCGFTSVMIDASEHNLEENIRLSRAVVEYAHARGVSVEAELGQIGTADFVESNVDEVLFTDPNEAAHFTSETGVDALAVSVGTAHGVYKVRQPRIDLERIAAIHAATPTHLVLHGGSGNPIDMIKAAIELPGGGVSKINIATDLELALLDAMGREEALKNAALKALPAAELERGLAAVRAIVVDKITHFLGSKDKAW